MKGRASKFSNAVNKSLSVFLAIATSFFLWLSVKLFENYTTSIVIPLKYENIPQRIKFNEPPYPNTTLTVSGDGHELLPHTLFMQNDSIRISVQNYVDKKYVSKEDIQPEVRKLFSSLNTNVLKPDTIKLNFDYKVNRKVPVVSRLKLFTKPGFLFVKKIKFEPDSIDLIGTPNEIKAHQYWETENITVADAYKTEKIKVPLKKSNEFSVEPNSVNAIFHTERYSEGEIIKKVTMLNLPLNAAVRFFPEQLKIKYLMPYNKFKQISPNDISVEVKYENLDFSTSYCMPVIKPKSNDIRITSVNPPHLKYLIKLEHEN